MFKNFKSQILNPKQIQIAKIQKLKQFLILEF